LFDEQFTECRVILSIGVSPEGGQDVDAEVAAVGGPLRWTGKVAGCPDRHPLFAGDPASGRVEVGVECLFDVDLLAADLGGGSGGVRGVGRHQ
jgi:hypothetical protein